MALTTDTPVSGTDETLTRRGLRHALDGTTDLAERELKVPLHYYRDPKITEIEESQILRQCRWPSSRQRRCRKRTTTWCARCSAIHCW